MLFLIFINFKSLINLIVLKSEEYMYYIHHSNILVHRKICILRKFFIKIEDNLDIKICNNSDNSNITQNNSSNQK